MNDRFKFRVWNKEQNRFHLNINCDITANGTLVITQGIEGKKYIIDDDNYVVQQCTGLKDKNGKLIYEGDIVRGKDHFDRDRKCIVRYSETYCCYFIVGDRWSDEYMFHLSDKEVVGNIYENKELLNE